MARSSPVPSQSSRPKNRNKWPNSNHNPRSFLSSESYNPQTQNLVKRLTLFATWINKKLTRNSNKFKRYKKNKIAVTQSQTSSLMKKFSYLIQTALNKWETQCLEHFMILKNQMLKNQVLSKIMAILPTNFLVIIKWNFKWDKMEMVKINNKLTFPAQIAIGMKKM